MKNLSPLNQRRLHNFVSNKRGLYSFWIFFILFIISLFADFIANEKPLLIKYENKFYYPILQSYSETTFGGDFETEADYRDPFVKNLINNSGWMIMPIIPYKYNTIIRDIDSPAPSPPSKKNWLGTDDQARDVLSRLIYGFRISILFGFTLTFFSMIIGVSAGAIQGYFGGKTDLFLNTNYVLGHSLGEYSALVASNVISLENCSKILKIRGELMQDAYPENKSGMAAVLGLNCQDIELLIKSFSLKNSRNNPYKTLN